MNKQQRYLKLSSHDRQRRALGHAVVGHHDANIGLFAGSRRRDIEGRRTGTRPIVTVGGTLARVRLLLTSDTTTPPAGAALVRVTAPFEDEPPETVDGLSVKDERTAGGGAVTVSVADLVTPP